MSDDDFPHAFRSLSDLQWVTARCHTCSYQVTLNKADLQSMRAVRTFGRIRQMAYCPACREAGEDRIGIVLRCEWETEPFEPRTIVVGQKPAPEPPPPRYPSPYENLPRRVLFKRRRLVA